MDGCIVLAVHNLLYKRITMQITVKDEHINKLIKKGFIVDIGNGTFFLNSELLLTKRVADSKSEALRIKFNAETKKFENIQDSDLISWEEAFPNVDVEQELRFMELWLDANPTRTKSQYKKFIVGWLTRKQDKGRIRYSVPHNHPDSAYYKTPELERSNKEEYLKAEAKHRRSFL